MTLKARRMSRLAVGYREVHAARSVTNGTVLRRVLAVIEIHAKAAAGRHF